MSEVFLPEHPVSFHRLTFPPRMNISVLTLATKWQTMDSPRAVWKLGNARGSRHCRRSALRPAEGAVLKAEHALLQRRGAKFIRAFVRWCRWYPGRPGYAPGFATRSRCVLRVVANMRPLQAYLPTHRVFKGQMCPVDCYGA